MQINQFFLKNENYSSDSEMAFTFHIKDEAFPSFNFFNLELL